MRSQVALHHQTHYQYDKPITLGQQTIRLHPAPHCQITVDAYSLNITPTNHFINWQTDPFANRIALIDFHAPCREFKVEVDLIATVEPFNPLDFFLAPEAKNLPIHYSPDLAPILNPMTTCHENSAAWQHWITQFNSSQANTVDFIIQLNQAIHETIHYAIRLEQGIQSCEQTLESQSGSCRDMAWLLCQTLRYFGLASRFVSGYLIQLVHDTKPRRGPAGPTHDSTDLHAWTEVYLPGAGWIGLDPTSGLLANEGHIPLCCTPQPESAAPVSGMVECCETDFSFSMSVKRLQDNPRVTKPYDDQSWQHILNLGESIDKRLQENEVQLTQGGEPTFVADSHVDAPEWNTQAMGDHKSALAKQLLLKLQNHFAPDSIHQYTQGKWYHSESEPRWAYHCVWRTDKQPLWQDPSLLQQPNPDAEQATVSASGQEFLTHLCHYLGVHHSGIHEHDSSGWVLPLQWCPERSRWFSSRWECLNGQLQLIHGDAPMGLRLPLDAIIKDPRDPDIETLPPKSSFSAANESLPEFDALTALCKRRLQSTVTETSLCYNSIKTALCLEQRHGQWYLFLPPTEQAEVFLDLITAIQLAAKAMNRVIILEGYPAPRSRHFQQFSITPDPGVLEVNIQPCTHWKELVHNTTVLYAECKQLGLRAEKFMMDGRHTGTGGGNHITLGSQQPENSPFLRRPDVLQSLITFWQHHPSLSYLFSGLFIGPTSQAPRIDEARHESLYDLEIAFSELPHKANDKPWLVDRLLRHLLVDITGNTHRAEFSIDKLYSPHGDMGRLGLLEMRGFEMPPHPQMAVAQSLLIRALIACFWKKPFHHPLVRWGTALHDRFMLSHYLWQDFSMVIDYLKLHGFELQQEWYRAFYEFRFPLLGEITHQGINVQLRHALEPWPVLAEEALSQQTSRGVDSAIERIEVKVNGLLPQSHGVYCNGLPLPLQATGQQGEFIAAVRFKAWDEVHTLHPTVPVHAPLVFDIVDKQQQRSMGGCRYHVAHPGGKNYTHLPINGQEAQARRRARFESFGHTPGHLSLKEAYSNPEFPHTLDLRRIRHD